jgi:hypothetical protein
MSGDGDVGVASANTQGTQMTALARAAEPPKPASPEGCGPIFVALIAGTVAFGLLGRVSAGLALLAGLAACAFTFVRLNKRSIREAEVHNRTKYDPAKARWDRSMMCMRCGSVTEMAD